MPVQQILKHLFYLSANSQHTHTLIKLHR